MEREAPCPRSEDEADLVWLRRDSGGEWRKVVVDVKVTSSDRMSEAFEEKDEKYRE